MASTLLATRPGSGSTMCSCWGRAERLHQVPQRHRLLQRDSAVGPPVQTCLRCWLERLAFTSPTATSIPWVAAPQILQAPTSSTYLNTHLGPTPGLRWV